MIAVPQAAHLLPDVGTPTALAVYGVIARPQSSNGGFVIQLETIAYTAKEAVAKWQRALDPRVMARTEWRVVRVTVRPGWRGRHNHSRASRPARRGLGG